MIWICDADLMSDHFVEVRTDLVEAGVPGLELSDCDAE